MMKAHLKDKEMKFCSDFKHALSLQLFWWQNGNSLTLHSLLALWMLHLPPITVFCLSEGGGVDYLSSLDLHSFITRRPFDSPTTFTWR